MRWQGRLRPAPERGLAQAERDGAGGKLFYREAFAGHHSQGELALAVANSFIAIARGAKRPPTQMKLQKLIFLAHGWNLALCSEPLIRETFQAWKYGPVVPQACHEFKDYGISGIDKEGTMPVMLPWQKGKIDFNWIYITQKLELNKEINLALINKIFDVYGIYNGNQISELTHRPDVQWSEARRGHPENERDIVIYNESYAA